MEFLLLTVPLSFISYLFMNQKKLNLDPIQDKFDKLNKSIDNDLRQSEGIKKSIEKVLRINNSSVQDEEIENNIKEQKSLENDILKLEKEIAELLPLYNKKKKEEEEKAEKARRRRLNSSSSYYSSSSSSSYSSSSSWSGGGGGFSGGGASGGW